MLHLDSPEVRGSLLKGKFGLEKEGLRVLEDASLALTPHPFPGDDHITRDFSEHQTEINTSAEPSAEGAVHALEAYARCLNRALAGMPQREFIWPFSNPPYIGSEEDIPVARFTGESASKTAYREYLAGRYGRYKMTFSGIHVNYSFSEELLKAEFSQRGPGRTRSFRDSFYLELAEKAAAYGWLLVILTAASPVLDASFFEAGRAKEGQPAVLSAEDIFSGMASVRCSELGYWNFFSPVFDYTNIQRYADGIRRYVEEGLLHSASELYYPVRLKPGGRYSLDNLKENGVDHLELRMFDINPFQEGGLDVRDVEFAQLFLVWLAALPRRVMTLQDQVLAVQNFKSAAHYDLSTVRIVMSDLFGEAGADGRTAAASVLERMQAFYRGLASDLPGRVQEVLDYQMKKIRDPRTRYAARVRREFSGTFLQKGMERAARIQGPRQDGISCFPEANDRPLFLNGNG